MSDPAIIECDQGSAEWFAARLGHLTSSRIADALRKAKRGTEELETRRKLRIELAVERLTQKPTEHFVSLWMERGTEMEPLARVAYELRTGRETRQVGFVLHPAMQWAGCSPDGLVGNDGMVEFKCPKSTTHAEYLIAECVPDLYAPQMFWQMACADRQWNDFVSYCPDFPEPLDLFICRLDRDTEKIAEMEAEARKFLEEVESTVTQLRDGLEGLLEKSIKRGPSLVPRAVIPRLEKIVG